MRKPQITKVKVKYETSTNGKSIDNVVLTDNNPCRNETTIFQEKLHRILYVARKANLFSEQFVPLCWRNNIINLEHEMRLGHYAISW